MNATPLKLIKSSIYVVNGTPARYTGEMQGESPVFSNHGTIIVGGRIEKANKEKVNQYLGR